MDVLTLWIFALIFMPNAEPALRYDLRGPGLPAGTLVLEGLDGADSRLAWRVDATGSAQRLAFGAYQAPADTQPAIYCGDDGQVDCGALLFGPQFAGRQLLIYLPPDTQAAIHDLVGLACASGHCGGQTVLLNGTDATPYLIDANDCGHWFDANGHLEKYCETSTETP